MAHIVIAYRESKPQRTLLRFGWKPDATLPNRSKEEALERATLVVEKVRHGDADFSKLAAEYSDDIVTRDRRGELGGLRVNQVPPEYLDAYATLSPGEVSHPFLTDFGYTLVKRLPVPAAEIVSGKRIVIGYQGTCCTDDDASQRRTRDAALALATQIAGEVRKDPASFDAAVRAYSESGDKVRGGDFGTWSLREPSDWPREIQILSALNLGAISEPVDSNLGIEIILRVPNPPRQRYAVLALQVNYDPTQLGSRENALGEISRLSARLQNDPTTFDELRLARCCREPRVWSDGRELPILTERTTAISIGDIAFDPVDMDWSFNLLKRIAPDSVSPEKLRYELPSPRHPAVENVIHGSPGAELSKRTREVRAAVATAFPGMSSRDRTTLLKSLDDLAMSFDQAGDDSVQRIAAYNAAIRKLRDSLGAEAFSEFMDWFDAWTSERMLHPERQ
jgi:hypothetical protein